jgi:hypothetical protein
MPLNPSYENDIFISYKSEDRLWALKLEADLSAKGFRVFLDKKRLLPGAYWEPSLRRAMSQSQHLVVLWSSGASKSEWVSREIAFFDNRNGTSAFTTASLDSLMIFIVLEEGNPQAFSNLEMIDDIRNAGAYAAGVEGIDKDIWRNVLRSIESSIGSNSNTQPVLLAIMATVKERLALVEPTLKPAGGFKSLKTFLEDLNIEGIKTLADLTSYYGDTPQDWRPFGSTKSIWTLMDELKDEINNFIPNRPIRWELIGNDFWSDDFGTRQQEASRLTPGWSVIVIDPISLYDNEVLYRVHNHLHSAFKNPRSVFISLPPFAMLTPYAHCRALLQQMASQIFDHHYNLHTFADESHAKCNLNIGDALDFKQCLLTSVGIGVRAGQTASSPVFLHQ